MVQPPSTAPAVKDSFSIDVSRLLRLFVEGRHEELSTQLIQGLLFIDRHSHEQLSGQDRGFINAFAECLLFFFARSEFVLSDEGARCSSA